MQQLLYLEVQHRFCSIPLPSSRHESFSVTIIFTALLGRAKSQNTVFTSHIAVGRQILRANPSHKRPAKISAHAFCAQAEGYCSATPHVRPE